MSENEESDVQEFIEEEHLVWEKNAPFLYDLLFLHTLEWPSSSCQWFPDNKSQEEKVEDDVDCKESDECPFVTRRILLGTRSSNTEDHIVIMSVKLPNPKADQNSLDRFFKSDGAKLEIESKILHEGEVSCARLMPQDSNLIASKVITGDILIFDQSKSSDYKTSQSYSPDLRLKGHRFECNGFAWSPLRKGLMASIAGREGIRLWDINTNIEGNKILESFAYHTNKESQVSFEDIDWHSKSESVFGTSSDNGNIEIWDFRESLLSSSSKLRGSSRQIKSLRFHPSQDYLLATGSQDNSVGLWDLRSPKSILLRLNFHMKGVCKVLWSPHDPSQLASAGGDRRICIWDLSNLEDSLTRENRTDGPPELCFVHGGHVSAVTDFCWSPFHNGPFCSVAENNSLQIWTNL